MATDVTDDDIPIVDTTYNIKLKVAISENFIHHVTDPNTLTRTLQKYNSDVLTHADIDYVKTLMRNTGPMAASEALLDRLYRYKNWFQCLLQAVNDDSIKLGFLENEFIACKDDLDEQILAEANEEKTNSSRHPDKRIPVSQRRENLRLKLNIEKLKRQQDEVCNIFKVQMKELQKELQLLKEISANQKEELSRSLEALTLCHEQLKKEFIQEKSSHDELKIHVEEQANENMEKENKLIGDLDERFQSLNMEKEELKSEVQLLKQDLGVLTLGYEQLQNDVIQEKSAHDKLKIHVEAQEKDNMEREKKSTEALDKRFQSLNMEQLQTKVKRLALPASLGRFLALNSDTDICYVPEKFEKMHKNGLTLLFIGPTAAGKSATGNTILGRRSFYSHNGHDTLEHVGIESFEYNGLKLKLVDGPGFDEDLQPFQRFISNIGATLGHGVDVFIFVLKFGGRFREAYRYGAMLFKKNFGSNFFRNFCVFLFTHGDSSYVLGEEGESLSKYCSNFEGPLKELIDECGGTVIFDNRTKDVNVKERQMESLMYLISKKISHPRLPAFKIPSEFNIS